MVTESIVNTEAGHIKFILCARRKREDSQARYFYEWGNIHVSLMLTTPVVTRVFQRYAQHFAITGVDSDRLIYPLSDMEWDNMADHWLNSYDDFVASLTDEGYRERMQPHKFGDDAFALALSNGRLRFVREGYRPGGGVKLVHWLRKNPSLTNEEFNRRYLDEYGPALVDALGGGQHLRKYVQNTQLEIAPERFKGTLFEHGDVGKYAGIDELWLETLDDVYRLCEDAEIHGRLLEAGEGLLDTAGSFSIVATERVVFDFVTPGEISPTPAIQDPESLESRAIAQGFRGWNVPAAPADLLENDGA